MSPQAARSGIPKGRRATGRALAGAALVGVAALVVAATSARAGGDFEHAFEHELGHLAAREVAAIGHSIFAGVHYAHSYERQRAYPTRAYPWYRWTPKYRHPEVHLHRTHHDTRPRSIHGRHRDHHEPVAHDRPHRRGHDRHAGHGARGWKAKHGASRQLAYRH